MSWSNYQKAFFEECLTGTGNIVLEAVAGSGKTTTAIEADRIIRGATGVSSLFLAFNKAIADEMKSRGVNGRTFHSVCYGHVLNHLGINKVEGNKTQAILMMEVERDTYMVYRSFVVRLVGLAKQVGMGVLVPDVEEAWIAICNHYDIMPESDTADFGYGLELARKVFDIGLQSLTYGIDFDDMLFYVIRHDISLPRYDVIFVDEAQDTNAIQRELLRRMLKPKGRLIAIGDPAQSIYGFRGADSSAMAILQREFGAKKLHLSITYRCPLNVVTYAQQWVPHIEAAETANEGVVEDFGRKWDTDVFQPLDLVVCRKTAPLIQLAYKFVRARVPVTVMGREIGEGLKALVNRSRANTLPAIVAYLEKARERETKKALAKDDMSKLETIGDRYDSLLCVIEDLPDDATKEDLFALIDEIFRAKERAVILCTIHKSKGLEADRVFWLEREACPPNWPMQDWQKQQELNLCYVATTRAKKELYFIK